MKNLLKKYRMELVAVFAVAFFWGGVWAWQNRPLPTDDLDSVTLQKQTFEEQSASDALKAQDAANGVDFDGEEPADDGAAD